MAIENNEIVEDVERVELPGTEEENTTSEVDETEEEIQEESEKKPNEQIVKTKQPEEPIVDKKIPADVENETPKEKALRLELESTRAKLRKERSNDIRQGESPVITSEKKELSPEKQALLKKYKPEEIESLREVLPVLAEDMGFVRSDQLDKKQYESKADEIIQSWVEKHPEYQDETLWNQVKDNFQKFYKAPSNPHDYKVILDRIHQDIFNIKPIGDKGKINAEQRKVNVASHAGASAPTSRTISTRSKITSGLRTDMLKGFSEEELAEMSGGED